jgi:RNA polymerase sigma-70 factor (TIGR02943 family)
VPPTDLPPSSASERSASAADGAAAAERWVREHGDILWRFALSRLRKPHLAEEVVQESLLSAIESYHRFSGESSERTWLLGITAHKIADCLRRERREDRSTAGSGTGPAKGPAMGPPEGESPPDDPFTQRGTWRRLPHSWASRAATDGPAGPEAMERAELLRTLTACLEKLPPGIAEAIWLRDLLEMPAEEVCQALGLSATNLWTRTHRGRLALRSCIERSLEARDGTPREPLDWRRSGPAAGEGGDH